MRILSDWIALFVLLKPITTRLTQNLHLCGMANTSRQADLPGFYISPQYQREGSWQENHGKQLMAREEVEAWP